MRYYWELMAPCVVIRNLIPHDALVTGESEFASDLCCLDAQDFVPAGSTWRYGPEDSCVGPRLLWRDYQ